MTAAPAAGCDFDGTDTVSFDLVEHFAERDFPEHVRTD